MTAAMIPFAFEDRLVRVYKPNGEPWFVGKDVCEVLDIRNHNDALKRLDNDERGTCPVGIPAKGVGNTDPLAPSGGEQTMVIVSEAGVFRLIFTSRKPEAERFKRWLAHEVLPALRRDGVYAVPGREGEAAELPAGTIAGEPVAVVTQKLSMVREARLIHGLDRARLLWDTLGLPTVPGGPEAAIADGMACLRELLARPLGENAEPGTPFTILHAILAGLDDSGHFEGLLRDMDIRVLPDQDGFVVSNRFGSIGKALWEAGKPYRRLLHVPGARRMGPIKFGNTTNRGVFIPATVLDGLDTVTAH